MSSAPINKRARVAEILHLYGLPYAKELGLDLSRNKPATLFRWLCASLLFSARISSKQAMKAARALSDAGWTTPEKLAKSTWQQRVRVLNRSGYARYDESTSRMLGETANDLIEQYRGDLRKLRSKAGCDPRAERMLLRKFKGVGDVGVSIFFREVQEAWPELYPFADTKALSAAKRLGLGKSAVELSRLVDRQDYVPLIAGLVRVDLGKHYDQFS